MERRKLRVSEIYLSIQGEGPRVGEPTVFIRFGGCNLRCPLWPCDSQFAIDPKYRHEWLQMTPQEVVDRVRHITQGRDKINICLTGGEPFLQPNDTLEELVGNLYELPWNMGPNKVTIECFSNGTLRYPSWALDQIAFVMDWKLGGSGEAGTGYSVRLANLEGLNPKDSIKFTIAGEEDYLQARHIADNMPLTPMQIFAGVVWGKLTNEQLVEWMLRDHLDWRLNVQVHNHVWQRDKRGI